VRGAGKEESNKQRLEDFKIDSHDKGDLPLEISEVNMLQI
jgi:hypothetical protein